MEKRSVLLRYVMAYVFLGAIWLLLAGKMDANELIAGMFVTLIIVILTSSHLNFLDDLKVTPVMPLYLIRYILAFLRALVEANVDMARRVLSPSLPIYPAVVEVHTELKSPLGKLLLANSITLTPGTLTVDVVDDILHVHWIDASSATDMHKATRLIAQQFEKHLSGIVR